MPRKRSDIHFCLSPLCMFQNERDSENQEWRWNGAPAVGGHGCLLCWSRQSLCCRRLLRHGGAVCTGASCLRIASAPICLPGLEPPTRPYGALTEPPDFPLCVTQKIKPPMLLAGSRHVKIDRHSSG